ncbi:MAG: lysophospholipase [Kiloniellales bacterium]
MPRISTPPPERRPAGWPQPFLCLLLAALLTAACAPRLAPPGPGATEPVLAAETVVVGDGLALPLRSWLPGGEPRAAILALHGFNDYSHAFEAPGRYWAEQGIAVYAYDQRGFGASPNPGLWPGGEAFLADLETVSALVAARHPGKPLYLLGESMGAAVIVAAAAEGRALPAAGLILSAPAVWGREAMPFYQRWTLWLAERLVPGMTVTGENLDIQASDNIEMLRALGRDPLFIKETRIDTIAGLVDLMSRAAAAGHALGRPTLLLYGEKDEVIPPEPVFAFLREALAQEGHDLQPALYPNGWHLLLRDLEARVVWDDIVHWVTEREGALPSGADRLAARRLDGGAS